MTAIRLIDAGTVPGVRSQALYHGLGHARTEASPDTVVLVTPAEPYVCVGLHQDLEREVDLSFCRDRRLPVLRRETGGGAVYIDADQLFVQWIMAPASLPARVEARYAQFCEPIVNTHHDLGLEATFRPINDVHVHGRKIVGTGAAQIGRAEVVTGNFIFDFDTTICAQVLNAPSEAFRDQVRRSLETYMTSLRRELGARPAPEHVADRYRHWCTQVLGRDLVPGELTTEEEAAIKQAEQRLLSDAFQRRPGGLKRGGVKIHEDVHVVESSHEGLRVTARMHGDRIEDVSVRMDGPPINGALAAVERSLRGVALRPEPVARAVNRCMFPPDMPGVTAGALMQAILALPHTSRKPDHGRP